MIQIIPMPKDCRECPFEMFYTNCGETRCRASNITLASEYKPIPYDCRPNFCPLVEVMEDDGK